ncbi:GlxA family transcriptional regulator [Streptomyces flavofungini]|uniref:GlxA family transcriptional regulator n=1 Tax=Streptomyces flavofungini TaxID=68200 RepID=A0ABS0X716_9ACTN|nr:GlxA family transcriptional regulator [Streptomyces flavofungini]MBJ3809006.1 GlxA family transcriptional regulator [Streptomyces flavofungini]GHC68089.1 AraC family transcriptional regulator [Streptomyces flavofungini]
MGGVARAGRAGRRVVAVVAFDGVQLLDVSGPVEVFTTANSYGAQYDLRVVSPSGRDVRTSSGVRVGVDGTVAGLPRRVDTLVVPGRRDWRRAVADTDLVQLTAALAARATRVTSVCAGAFVLAEAGLLDGRRAATHWELARELAAAYPRVRVAKDPLFVRDGPVVTSAGVTAGIDLALALVEDDHGAHLAREVARQLVVFMARPGGQSQFSKRLAPEPSEGSVVRRVLDAVTADPAADHSLDSLARQAGVSARHLGRLFRAETGMTPGQYVEAVRLEAARALLEAGPDTVEEVARRAGFGSSESLRRVFQLHLGVAPTAYRARFRTTAAGAGPVAVTP